VGLTFHFGTDEATELTEAQVLSQLKMYIAALRISDDHYARAVAGWSVLEALADFRHDAHRDAVQVPPPRNAGIFGALSCQPGVGLLLVDEQHVRLECTDGQIELRSVSIPDMLCREPIPAGITEICLIPPEDGSGPDRRLECRVPTAVTIEAEQALTIRRRGWRCA